jgi:protein-disulfide isomerase
MTETRPGRRAAIVQLGALAALGGALGAAVWRRSDPPLRFKPMTRPEGYRWLMQDGASSGVAAALVGIGAPKAQVPIGDLCTALFQGARAPGAASIALFTDYRCPYCKILDKRLLDLADASPARIRLHVHEWPALGPTSERMARIAIAARAQGAWRGMHALLSATPFMPSDGWIARSAEKLGLSAPRLLRDMSGSETERVLAQTSALAALFGFEGTPGVVIGRNVAAGFLTDEMLKVLVEDARDYGTPPGCA